MRKSPGLLDYIAEKAGCSYLSDLHNKGRGGQIYKVIAGIAPSDYDLKEWEDAIRYITNRMVSFGDSSQAAEYLLQQLKTELQMRHSSADL